MAPLGEYEFFKTSNPSSSASPSTLLVTEGGNGRDGRDSPTSGIHGEDLETTGTVSRIQKFFFFFFFLYTKKIKDTCSL